MVEENGTGGSVDALVSQGTGSPIVVTSVSRLRQTALFVHCIYTDDLCLSFSRR